jgi:coenzyme F420-reducing hydrogenase delta subunit
MSDKPSYLKVLNAIANGEARGYALFDAWAKTTRDAELAQTLKIVAIRENEHAAAFTKRMCELGYDVRDKPAADFDARLQCVRSSISDAEKFESAFGYGRERGDEGLAGIFNDTTIDPVTGALLGRFIAEERDTTRRLQAAYERVKVTSMDDSGLDQISQRLERLTKTIEELKAMRQDRR